MANLNSKALNYIFDTPILQSFLVKSNLVIDLSNLIDTLPVAPLPFKDLSYRSGTIIAIKYKNTIKGKDTLFKTKIGFKNACHLIMCHTLDKRKKKLIHIKITAIGTFQVVGIPAVDVEKVIYKVFLLLEKLNKNNDIFTYISPKNDKQVDYRLEIVIVPILKNYMLSLDPEVVKKLFCHSKVEIIQKFIDNKFLSFMVPNDSAITIKKSFLYKDFSNHPVQYITWNKKYGKLVRYIEYDSYTTLLKDIQKENARCKKYLTLRLYSSGKFLVSGFDEILIKKGVESFLSVCDQF
jgi:hypothetical protein